MKNLLLRVLDRFEELFCVFSLLFVTGILFLNIILRYIFRSGFVWSEELIRYLMIWIAFIGISMATRQGKRMAVDLVLVYSSPSLRRLINIIVDLTGCVFGGLITYYGYISVSTLSRSAQVSPGLGIPMFVPYLVIPVAGALLVLRFGQSAWDNLQGNNSTELGKTGEDD